MAAHTLTLFRIQYHPHDCVVEKSSISPLQVLNWRNIIAELFSLAGIVTGGRLRAVERIFSLPGVFRGSITTFVTLSSYCLRADKSVTIERLKS